MHKQLIEQHSSTICYRFEFNKGGINNCYGKFWNKHWKKYYKFDYLELIEIAAEVVKNYNFIDKNVIRKKTKLN